MKKALHWWDRTAFGVSSRVYLILLGISFIFVLSYFLPGLFDVARLLAAAFLITFFVDLALLFARREGLSIQRQVPERFSNGDENRVTLLIKNQNNFRTSIRLVDELPMQLQARNWKQQIELTADTQTAFVYTVQPKERGTYEFGTINAEVKSPLGLAVRRYFFDQEQTVKVYPSFIQMRRFQIMAVSNNMQQTGVKRVRRLGHSLEFEQIKEYVRGDDYRTINWKATARRGDVMVNTFTDERSQPIYCVVNKGRVMKMPFEGMTLLDYAINASLVISNIALQKQDKAGLITFGKTLDTFLLADKKPTQVNAIMESLYRQQTDFGEPDFEKLFSAVRNRITHRSLLILFTNFETVESLQRELPNLKRLAHYHLLMVVFFENTELKQLTNQKAKTTEDIYIKTIADKFRNEKKLMVRELRANGILTLLTTPEQLSIKLLNKYLELKNRQSI
jgi:uncharacterized protein (DUF58 family)